LNNDNTFKWKFNQGKTDHEFEGKYTYDQNVLALEQNGGGSLIAGVVPTDDSKKQINFKLIGAPKEDPGLDFSR